MYVGEGREEADCHGWVAWVIMQEWHEHARMWLWIPHCLQSLYWDWASRKHLDCHLVSRNHHIPISHNHSGLTSCNHLASCNQVELAWVFLYFPDQELLFSITSFCFFSWNTFALAIGARLLLASLIEHGINLFSLCPIHMGRSVQFWCGTNGDRPCKHLNKCGINNSVCSEQICQLSKIVWMRCLWWERDRKICFLSDERARARNLCHLFLLYEFLHEIKCISVERKLLNLRPTPIHFLQNLFKNCDSRVGR